MESDYILARPSQLNFYKEVPLYIQTGDNYIPYKLEGQSIGDMRLDQNKHPQQLYILKKDKIKGLQEAQKGFNNNIKKHVKSGNIDRVKETLVTIMTETLAEPLAGSLEGLSDTVDVLVNAYVGQADVIKNLLNISTKDYSTALHSINVMAISISFAAHNGFDKYDTKILGLAGLLHDVGKTKIKSEILQAQQKLSVHEYNEIRRHTIFGFNILDRCYFSDNRVKMTALDHHERQDGEGYPNNKTTLPKFAKVVGIIDCYEALTNDDRPYRNATKPMKALNIIKKEVHNGKFDKKLFEQLVCSLV